MSIRRTQAGERLAVGLDNACTIQIGGRNADRITVVSVLPQGVFQPLERVSTDGEWRLNNIADLGEKAEILVYITDDPVGGLVNESHPITEEIVGNRFHFPPPSEQLAACIIPEAYRRDGNLRDPRAVSENVNFCIEVSLVREMFAASGIDIPSKNLSHDNNRHNIVRGLRKSVTSGLVTN